MELSDRLDRCLRTCMEAAVDALKKRPRASKWTELWVETRHRLVHRDESPYEFDVVCVERNTRTGRIKQRLAYRGAGEDATAAVHCAVIEFEKSAGLAEEVEVPDDTYPVWGFGGTTSGLPN